MDQWLPGVQESDWIALYYFIIFFPLNVILMFYFIILLQESSYFPYGIPL